MSTIYTSGTWRTRAGQEDDFVEAWSAFAEWANTMPGCGTLRLVRDLRDGHFVSFGDWESEEAAHAWKSQPDFKERIARVLVHVDGFEPSELALVATAGKESAVSAV